MIYYADSECFHQFYCLCWKAEDGTTGILHTPEEIHDWLYSLGPDDTVVTKNGLKYDFVIWLHAIEWHTSEDLSFEEPSYTEYLRRINDEIILENKHRISAARMQERLASRFKFKHIDVQELLNMFANLKRAAGSLGHPNMMESSVPFSYKGEFIPKMKAEVEKYCLEDCAATQFLYSTKDCSTELISREIMKDVFMVDVQGLGRPRAMTKIISELFERTTGQPIWDAKNEFYREPRSYHFGKILRDIGKDSRIKFDLPELQEFGKKLVLFKRDDEAGSIGTPGNPSHKKTHYTEAGILKSVSDQFAACEGYKLDITLEINGTHYRFKEGGIHSENDRASYFSDDRVQLYDIDFTAFYPGLLLRFDIFPSWMMDCGFDIRALYQDVVDKNLTEKAKPDGNKKLRNVYKIFSNLFYGKYGEKTDPLGDLRLQLKTCLTGQMVLLRMIEKMEAAGIQCLYANTDGICVACPRGLKDAMDRILSGMATALNIGIEPVPITAMYIDNANSYLWEMGDGEIKTKKEYSSYQNMSNPTLKYPIVKLAVQKYLVEAIPIEDTIRGCKDIHQFGEVKSATRSAINFTAAPDVIKELKPVVAEIVAANKRELDVETAVRQEILDRQLPFKLLPKNLRYYHAVNANPLYKLAHGGASAGRISMHPLASSCVLMLDHPQEFPGDVDYDFYIDKAKELVGNWKPVERLENIFAD